jgi:hypothetical protein
MRSVSLAVAVLVSGLLLSSCGDSGSGDGGFRVTSEVVSHEGAKDMLVFAPDAQGRWPVIVAFHGVGGSPDDMAEMATRLAGEGEWCSPRPTAPRSRRKKAWTRRRSMRNADTDPDAASRPSTGVTSISR